MSHLLRALAVAALLAALPAFAKKPLGPADRVDLNRASVPELTRLPGVGEKKAQAIVAARGKKPFARVEDLTSVKGFGPTWLAKHRGNLTVGTSSPPPAAAAPPRK